MTDWVLGSAWARSDFQNIPDELEHPNSSVGTCI